MNLVDYPHRSGEGESPNWEKKPTIPQGYFAFGRPNFDLTSSSFSRAAPQALFRRSSIVLKYLNSNFPKSFEDGIHIKIIFSFYLKPWHRSKLRPSLSSHKGNPFYFGNSTAKFISGI